MPNADAQAALRAMREKMLIKDQDVDPNTPGTAQAYNNSVLNPEANPYMEAAKGVGRDFLSPRATATALWEMLFGKTPLLETGRENVTPPPNRVDPNTIDQNS